MSGMPDIKICGLTRPEDAVAAERSGARYGGVILAPGSRRRVTAEGAAKVFAATGLRRCGVVVDESAETLMGLADVLKLDVLQLHGDEQPELISAVRRVTGCEIWKAVRVRDGADFEQAIDLYGELVDGFLLDGWSPLARGGIGTRFPWAEVGERRALLPEGVRLFVAGGLDPESVGQAIREMSPDGVDVSSGVEDEPGIKNHRKIEEFVASVRATRNRERVG